MFAALLDGALPALRKFGFGFFVTSVWDPVTEEFGILHQVYGTLVTSAIAMLIATPIGIGIAIFLTELCPRVLRRPLGTAIELLAGIPSIIYGIWGLFVFAPFFQQTVQPWIIDTFSGVPLLSLLFAGPPFGVGIFTASVILAIMILPLISSLTRDVFNTVPPILKDGAYALGSTLSEVINKVVLPYSRQGIVGAAMLALGRALGETMAVTFVIGNANRISASLFAPGTTISAAIANEFSEAVGDLYLSSLLAAGLFLMFITFVVLASAQLMLGGIRRRAGAGH
jgi:phosphate transport system permease protein